MAYSSSTWHASKYRVHQVHQRYLEDVYKIHQRYIKDVPCVYSHARWSRKLPLAIQVFVVVSLVYYFPSFVDCTQAL